MMQRHKEGTEGLTKDHSNKKLGLKLGPRSSLGNFP